MVSLLLFLDGEFAEDRLTVLVATNMTGTDKRKLLVIGNSENPRSFCNEIIKPVQYEYDHRAWMTAGIFRNFVCRWDAELSRTSSKALLLVDDRSVHRSAPARLRSIRVTYFPDDASSSIRPMRAGLLERLSVNYKRQQILHLAERVEMNRYPCKTTVLRAVRALKSAWENVSPRTVADCFGRVGLTATTGAPVADLHCPTTTGLLDRWAENLLICDSRTLGQYERVDAALATDDRHACAMGCTATTLSRNEEGGDNEVDLNAAFGALDDLKRFFSADGRLSRRSYRHTKRLQTLLESTRY